MSRPARCTRGRRKGRCAVTNPCWDCPDRRVGCQIKCPRRGKWLEEECARKAAEAAARKEQGMFQQYVQESKRRYKRRTGKK